MRVPYVEPSILDYDKVFDVKLYIKGGSLDQIRVFRQQGGSILGALSGLVSRALPFLRSVILPEIGSLVKNVTSDYGNNVSLKQTLRKNSLNSGKNIARKLMGGSKKKRIINDKRIRQTKLNRYNKGDNVKTHCKPLNDIFSSD